MVGFFIIILLRIFEAGGAKVIIQATAADGVIAGITVTQAMITGRALARFAGRAAFIAERFIAAGAAIRAAVTESRAAAITGVLVIFIDRVAAIGTRRTMPVGKPTVCRSRVVSPENLGHEEKELSQTSLFQCPGNGVSTLAFTEGLALHMRVRHIIATAGATRIESGHLIGLMTTELIQRKPDFKRSEVDPFQNDPFRPDAEDLRKPVDVDLIKFILDRLKFLKQQSQRRKFRR